MNRIRDSYMSADNSKMAIPAVCGAIFLARIRNATGSNCTPNSSSNESTSLIDHQHPRDLAGITLWFIVTTLINFLGAIPLILLLLSTIPQQKHHTGTRFIIIPLMLLQLLLLGFIYFVLNIPNYLARAGRCWLIKRKGYRHHSSPHSDPLSNSFFSSRSRDRGFRSALYRSSGRRSGPTSLPQTHHQTSRGRDDGAAVLSWTGWQSLAVLGGGGAIQSGTTIFNLTGSIKQ